jgi:pyruvate/2-oxoglutarate dehydrogenase complex dihydrolipoamide acyltransferase (E2) component
MSDTGASSGANAVFQIEPKNKYFEAIRAMAEYEIRPGNTVSLLTEVDLSEVERLRSRAPSGQRPSYTAFVVKAVALALRDFPYANRRVCRPPWLLWAGTRLQKFPRIDIAVAVERDFPGAESMVFIDIVRDADHLSLQAITDVLSALATADVTTNKQWREFSTIIRRTPSWLATLLIRLPVLIPSLWVKYRGGAVLISSPAKYGVDVVVGTWTHAHGVSFGLVKPRPVVRGSEIVACTTFALTLNFDRRVMAGAPAARFFKRMIDVLEQAETEMAPYFIPTADVASREPKRDEVSALGPGSSG